MIPGLAIGGGSGGTSASSSSSSSLDVKQSFESTIGGGPVVNFSSPPQVKQTYAIALGAVALGLGLVWMRGKRGER